MDKKIQVDLLTEEMLADADYERSLFKIEDKIYYTSSHADNIDYFVAVSTGVLCAVLDNFWVKEFNLLEGRKISEDKVKQLVIRIANMLGYKGNDLKKAIVFLEERYPLAADGNTKDFGGGLQHHLRDFAHHPTIVGLVFSLFTQFTKMSYGTDVNGNFIVVPISEKSRECIGDNVVDKIFKGTIIWFSHLVSDMAGSRSSALLSGGTGIPGPILSLAKELSVLPIIKDIKLDDKSISVFLSKLFNGTLFASRDENGKIIKDSVIKFDLRGELGGLIEIGKQVVPVIINECVVRGFYFIRCIINEIRRNNLVSIDDFYNISWDKVKPFDNPTLTRMLFISSGIFTTLDVTDAIITKKYWVSVNYVGIGRFTVALGSEMINGLKKRNLGLVNKMYQEIEKNTYNKTDDNIYERMVSGMDIDKFGLTIEQTEILYNLEVHKTMNDIEHTIPLIGMEKAIHLKMEWINEWKQYIEKGFSGFVHSDGEEINWYSKEELINKVRQLNPEQPWFRLMLLEVMLFEPYYAISLEKDKKGNLVPSKKYKDLNNGLIGYKKDEGDKFLEEYFQESFYQKGYIKRLRKCYGKVLRELNEVLKTTLMSVSVASAIALAAVITGGIFAPSIATVLVGANFTGLSGAALTNACLAYLGGGAIAAGGLGMVGGTATIIGGSAILGMGVGAGVGGSLGALSMIGKKQMILQSAKLIVSVREIFLNDEHDIEYSNSVYEKYVNNIVDIEKGLVELKLKAESADKESKKKLNEEIKNKEDTVKAMKVAMKSMRKFNSAFQEGMNKE